MFIPYDYYRGYRHCRVSGGKDKGCTRSLNRLPGSKPLCCQLDRSASTIFMREARTAGRTPPTNPMMSENAIASKKISRVKEKEKASSEKVWKFRVETVNNWRNDAKNSPTMPPRTPRNSASMTNAKRMLLL